MLLGFVGACVAGSLVGGLVAGVSSVKVYNKMVDVQTSYMCT